MQCYTIKEIAIAPSANPSLPGDSVYFVQTYISRMRHRKGDRGHGREEHVDLIDMMDLMKHGGDAVL